MAQSPDQALCGLLWIAVICDIPLHSTTNLGTNRNENEDLDNGVFCLQTHIEQSKKVAHWCASCYFFACLIQLETSVASHCWQTAVPPLLLQSWKELVLATIIKCQSQIAQN